MTHLSLVLRHGSNSLCDVLGDLTCDFVALRETVVGGVVWCECCVEDESGREKWVGCKSLSLERECVIRARGLARLVSALNLKMAATDKER
jgi:hypothetical protein